MPEFTADDNKEIVPQAFDTLLISRNTGTSSMDEASREASVSGLPMFGDNFPEDR